MNGEAGAASRLEILYDGDCPFCSRFVELYRIRRNVGTVALVNARERPDLVRRFRDQGYEINNGMIVSWNGRDYFGADAMRLLAMLGSEHGLFAALNRLLFRNAAVAAAIYPMLVAGRRATLRLLRRDLIERSPGLPETGS